MPRSPIPPPSSRSHERGRNPGRRRRSICRLIRRPPRASAGGTASPTVLRVDAGKMHTDGHIFTCSDNEVWLTDSVPAGYLGFGVVQ